MTMLLPAYSLFPVLPPSQIPLSCTQVPSIVDIDAYELCFSNVILKLRPFQSIYCFFRQEETEKEVVKDIKLNEEADAHLAHSTQ
jgi:hypothetical protein